MGERTSGPVSYTHLPNLYVILTFAQTVKLFLAPDVEIPAGCKIVVTRFNNLERKFTYSKSGEAGVFTNHQAIQLAQWKGYA